VSGARTEAAAGTAGALALTGVRKSFGGVEALRGANLTCRRGEIHALIGENGAGKSTLVKVLSGAIQADVGDVELDGRPLRVRSPREAQAAGISTVFQELSLIPDLTVAGNLFYGREPRVRAGRIDYRALRSAAAEALAQLGLGWIDVAKTARELPLSDRQLLEIAKSLLREPAVLVLDEATSALLPEQVDWLFARVRAFAERGGIALFISHRLEEIQHLSHRVTVFRAGVDVGSGPIAEMPEARLVELMLGRRVDRVYPPRLPAPEGREVVCEVVGLSAPPTLRDVSLEVRRGEVLGVGGLQGQGQLPLFLALFGARRHAGQVLLERQALRLRKPADALAAGIALIPEDRTTEGLCLALSIRDNLTLGSLGGISRGGLIRPRRERDLVDSLASGLSINMRHVSQEVLALSGGNQQKVLLGRVLAQKPRLLLMYDATRGVDVGTKAEIYRLMRELCAEGVAILFYSTDVNELANLADRVVVLHDGVVGMHLDGDEITESNILAAAVGGLRKAVS